MLFKIGLYLLVNISKNIGNIIIYLILNMDCYIKNEIFVRFFVLFFLENM